MYDRPTLGELIDAARMHVETHIVPVLKAEPSLGRLYFQTLVAVNVLRIAEREIGLRGLHLGAQWSRLNALHEVMGDPPVPLPANTGEAEAALSDRVRGLCERIRAGAFDVNGEQVAARSALFDHLLATTREALQVANPKFLETAEREWEAVSKGQRVEGS